MAARRRLGQHFLRDRKVLARIVRALEIDPGDRILEIGAGDGTLTRELVATNASISAIELDERLASLLAARLHHPDNLTVLNLNALQFDIGAFAHSRNEEERAYKLAGNIPYYITGSLLRKFLDTPCRPSIAVLMVQLEVARRMLAGPGEMNLLALNTRIFAEGKIVITVPPEAFAPRPKVHSAVVALRTRPQALVALPDTVFHVARAGFSSKRKQLANSIAHGLEIDKGTAQDMLQRSGIPTDRRPQDLDVDDWAKLAAEYVRAKNAHLGRSKSG